MSTTRTVVSKLGGALLIALIVLSLVYSIVAEVSSPPLSPAAEVIALQSDVMGGVYYLKLTFLVTWLLLLLPIATGGILLSAIAQRWSQRRNAPSETPNGPQWTASYHRNRWRIALAGAVMLAPAIPFLVLLFTDTGALAILSYFSILGLIAAPILACVGLAFLLDGVIPPARAVGNVTSIVPLQINGRPTGTHSVSVNGRVISVPDNVASGLSVGTKVAMKSTALWNILLELHVHQPGYRG